MKKTYKEERVVDVTSVFCDKCGDEVISDIYDAFSCNIDLTIGEYTPDGLIGEQYDIDLCKTCAKDLFLNIMPKQGIKVNEI